MMMKLTIIIVTLLLSSFARASAPIAQLQFFIEQGLPTVKVFIEDIPVSLFIDTGSFASISLNKTVLAGIPVRYTGVKMEWSDADGINYMSKGFVIPGLSIGNMYLKEVEGMESAGSGLRLRASGHIGLGILQRFLVVLDYQKKIFSLYHSGDISAMTENCGKETLPLKNLNGVLQSIFHTDRGDLVFQWDSGSTEDIIRPSALNLIDYKSQALSLSKFETEGLDFGRTVFTLREFQAPKVDGVIGSSFFDSRVVCIDISNKRAAIRK